MPDSAVQQQPAAPSADSHAPRHTLTVRVTHWITVACFLALLVSGCELVISHPRFYWGETGNVGMAPLFSFHIPSSRGTVPTGYKYVLPDQNGWSRYLHFQSAWIAVLTGLVYALSSLVTGHLRRNLLPRAGLSLRALRPDPADAHSYNPLQRVTYLFVIFGLFPLVIWTGLAMSPAFDSAVPAAVNLLGGRQSARTLHFFVSAALVIFLLVHLAMVWLAGFRIRVGAMITGRAVQQEDQ